MRCEDARRRAVEREFGPIDARAAQQLEQHLARCTTCAAALDDERRMIHDMAALRAITPALHVDVTDRVMDRLEPARHGLTPGQWALSAAAAAVFAVLLVLATPGGHSAVGELAASRDGLTTATAGVGEAIYQPAVGRAATFTAIGAQVIEALSVTADSSSDVALGLMAAGWCAMAALAALVLRRDRAQGRTVR